MASGYVEPDWLQTGYRWCNDNGLLITTFPFNYRSHLDTIKTKVKQHRGWLLAACRHRSDNIQTTCRWHADNNKTAACSQHVRRTKNKCVSVFAGCSQCQHGAADVSPDPCTPVSSPDRRHGLLSVAMLPVSPFVISLCCVLHDNPVCCVLQGNPVCCVLRGNTVCCVLLSDLCVYPLCATGWSCLLCAEGCSCLFPLCAAWWSCVRYVLQVDPVSVMCSIPDFSSGIISTDACVCCWSNGAWDSNFLWILSAATYLPVVSEWEGCCPPAACLWRSTYSGQHFLFIFASIAFICHFFVLSGSPVYFGFDSTVLMVETIIFLTKILAVQ